jgi:hypothetical protein
VLDSLEQKALFIQHQCYRDGCYHHNEPRPEERQSEERPVGFLRLRRVAEFEHRRLTVVVQQAVLQSDEAVVIL